MKFPDQLARASLTLSDYLCFAVYSANLAFGKAYKPILNELGITYTQYITVVALWETDNQTVGGLGERLFLESNTLTPILKKLERMGYLERQRDPEDERQVRILLTKSGRYLCEKALTTNLSQLAGLAPDKFANAQKAVVALRNELVALVKHSN
ncbi:MarR family protein [Burkholderia sp. YR290]|jgi:DNA-binding MarR family transcriptional regulator|uniref:MarR family transcriptional regulator n=1 Tax=Paraburkholderia hospita TaxID=169430 RepID=A0ABP2PZH9_9BURK|nr:MarR family transcriptional regulator [Paraburkholderia hospita]EIN03200.1 MarR family transcriptional regulator [Paraburkholderia hospita]OUL70881.1 MarR family transcriptional regulator [Paraburkholderia hospita]SOE85477.1 MarR family protein [Burkholderia sp. YR290]